jgi:hypothetical protein
LPIPPKIKEKEKYRTVGTVPKSNKHFQRNSTAKTTNLGRNVHRMIL